MITRETIENILLRSVNAPSGSNSQPWRFEIRNGELLVIALPEKDHPILNYRNRGTLIAHGALIENIKIVASTFGYGSEIEIFPDSKNPNVTARIKFVESAPSGTELLQALKLRTTNRKPYNVKALTSEQLNYIFHNDELAKSNVLKYTTDKKTIERLGQAVAVNELITLENQNLHRLFFNEILWNKTEEVKRKMGLYIKTMELKPPQVAILKLLKHWSLMKFAANLGFAKGVAAGNAQIYAKTPVMGAVVVNDKDDDFITAGRIIERAWLKATSLGLSFHLITGVMFFWQRIFLGHSNDFSEKHRELIESEYQAIASAFGAGNGIVAAIFRVGDGGSPSALSTKQLPIIE